MSNVILSSCIEINSSFHIQTFKIVFVIIISVIAVNFRMIQSKMKVLWQKIFFSENCDVHIVCNN